MPIPQLKTISKPKADFWRNNHSPKKKNLKLKHKLIVIVMLLAALGLLAAFILVAWASRDLPNPNQLINREVAQSTKIYDRSGEHILYEIHGEEKRTLINLEEVPDSVKNATISIEDKNFYKHGGFSIWAMVRTVITNVIYNRKAGGSTLTQQFIKNAVLSSEKSYVRKIKEIILAQRIEKKFSKDEILQMYLNEIPYGSNTYGVEAASQKYFGKSVRDINLAESALLAALPQSPSRYSPYGNNKDLLLGRKDYILDLMAEQGYISEAEKNAAKSYEIKFEKQETNITAPHFVMMIKELLSQKYGETEVEQGGLKIYTTIDWDKQKNAEEAIKNKTENYQEKYNANNAALVAIDPKTGQVLAMVGSRDYFDDEIDGQVNVTTRPRQPGSSMKPIIYASLFEQGYTPNTKLYDVVTNFSTDSGNPYTPHNYNGKELGPVSIRQALAGSLNIPAVKAIYLAGINQVLNLAENLGYSTFGDRSRFGLSLVLGGGEVKMIEHVNAYSAFSREGKVNEIALILKIEDKDGKILEEYKNKQGRALTTKAARMINSILSDNDARAYVFGPKNWLILEDRPVAAKTGTTNDFRDAWTIGYTPSLVAGVWVGNTDNTKMKAGADGSVVAAPIWNEFMKKSLTGTPVEIFNALSDEKTGKAAIDGELEYMHKIIIDGTTGLPANINTLEENKVEVEIYNHHSILYYVDKNDPLGPEPKDPTTDPQFLAWEEAIQRWAQENNQSSNQELINNLDLIKLENQPNLNIISPQNGAIVSSDILKIIVDANAPRGISTIKYYLNDELLPGQGSEKEINISLAGLPNGYQTITVIACDDVGNCKNESVNYNLVIQ
ncbi:PBP1A family penicillin-binding protein [Patescibacteria group bacterium]|nr:PBP1A family penicillin-binding protein [Patescibacteria group bacterium]